jgi:predicted DNA-binding antitoxin AbrB/MazE fold protein
MADMIQVEAVFENGVFRPLQPVRLADQQRVTVVYEDSGTADDQAHFVVSEERWLAFCEALDAPPKELPRLRKLLTEPGLFDDDRIPPSASSPHREEP